MTLGSYFPACEFRIPSPRHPEDCSRIKNPVDPLSSLNTDLPWIPSPPGALDLDAYTRIHQGFESCARAVHTYSRDLSPSHHNPCYQLRSRGLPGQRAAAQDLVNPRFEFLFFLIPQHLMCSSLFV
ncbi:hypothetical protein I7I48_03227 [Histoplasma ohiense]|nr:hypothetical protein I7I48_03227 [Histoplasma ohiense (nom. inval.)]